MELAIEATPIPGLLVVRLPLHEDARGWFKENWQRETMVGLGLPDFRPVQNNISYNAHRGATRGVHAEPWDKYVAVATGQVYAAWVDLREGHSFGSTFEMIINPGVAVYVPRGVGNAYQALEDGTAYTYLVNDHWHAGVPYVAVDLADPTAAIAWPIPLARAEVSEKDRANPRMDAVVPMPPRRTLVLGAQGQLGRALQAEFQQADGVDINELDLTDAAQVAAWPWAEYDVILNASAYTAVDAAETPAGRRTAWAANAIAPARLAGIAQRHRITFVHYSSEYVFDGIAPIHTEDEPLSPLGVYGQSKAAGDLAVAGCDHHYLLRTSWVIGEGRNFVRTMLSLAGNGTSPSVVDDQTGRLTFTSELARATRHLLESGAPYGTYNLTNEGSPMSWAEVAQEIFRAAGRSADDVTAISTEEYGVGKVLAPRPANSVLDLSKIKATGFEPEDAMTALTGYLARERS